MNSPRSSALLKKLIASIERVGHYLELLRQDLNRQGDAIRTAQENAKHQRDVKPAWFEPVLAKYDQAARNRKEKEDSQYHVQNSLRWATWLTFGAIVIYSAITLLIYCANNKAANAAKSAADTSRDALRLQYGSRVRANFWMGWYDLGEGKIPSVVVEVQNDGPTPAEFVEFVGQLQFREFQPEPNTSSFSVGTRRFIHSNRILGPQGPEGVLFTNITGYTRIDALNPTEYTSYKEGKTKLYAWGTLHYKDRFNESPDPITICRYVSRDQVLVADSDRVDGKKGGGYQGPYTPCDVPKKIVAP